jgi:hypothetical protein
VNRERLRLPPSSFTGDQYQWLQEVWKAVNAIPTISYFSGTNPNSVITGLGGHVLINVAASPSASRMWVKTNSGTAPDKLSWSTII